MRVCVVRVLPTPSAPSRIGGDQGSCRRGGGALYPGGLSRVCGGGAGAGVSGPGAGVSGAADVGAAAAGATCSAPSIMREPEQEQRIGRAF